MCPVQWDHTDHARSTRCVKQDWEKLYRAAILESDRSRLLAADRARRGRDSQAITNFVNAA